MENFLEKIKIKDFKNKFFAVLSKRRKFLLFILFLLAIDYAGYLWYSAVYNYSWDESKKQEYIKSKTSEENSFNKIRFENIVSKVEKRKIDYQNQNETPRDIFGIE